MHSPSSPGSVLSCRREQAGAALPCTALAAACSCTHSFLLSPALLCDSLLQRESQTLRFEKWCLALQIPAAFEVGISLVFGSKK